MHYVQIYVAFSLFFGCVGWSRRAAGFDDQSVLGKIRSLRTVSNHAHQLATCASLRALTKILFTRRLGIERVVARSGQRVRAPVAKMGKAARTRKKLARLEAKNMKKERRKLAKPKKDARKEQPYRYYCVCDFEATCCKGVNFPFYENEIIEFPVVVIDSSEEEARVVDEFHTFVRPKTNVTLSSFCSQLTGITQEQVDAAPTLPEALEMFDEWRKTRGLNCSDDGRNFAFVTDGLWDFNFLTLGCNRSGVEVPAYFDTFCNIKDTFAGVVKHPTNYQNRTIPAMLEYLRIPAKGRRHSGIDDARDIANISLKLIAGGAKLNATRKREKSMNRLLNFRVFRESSSTNTAERLIAHTAQPSRQKQNIR